MDNSNLSDLSTFPGYGSRLLSESPLPQNSTLDNRDTTDADLSLSELSVTDPPRRLERFSLLAPRQESHRPEEGDSLFSDVAGEGDVEENEEPTPKKEQDQRLAGQALREDKLRGDIFILRKLNNSFALFNDALQETTSANQRIATQLEHTDALLNKYIQILSKSDKYSHLIFDEQWHGAEEDELIIERERLQELERRRKEAEEREKARIAAKLEEERQKREEEERVKQEELHKNTAVKSIRGTASGRSNTTRSRAGSRIGSVSGRGRVVTATRSTTSARGSTARSSASSTSRVVK